MAKNPTQNVEELTEKRKNLEAQNKRIEEVLKLIKEQLEQARREEVDAINAENRRKAEEKINAIKNEFNFTVGGNNWLGVPSTIIDTVEIEIFTGTEYDSSISLYREDARKLGEYLVKTFS